MSPAGAAGYVQRRGFIDAIMVRTYTRFRFESSNVDEYMRIRPAMVRPMESRRKSKTWTVSTLEDVIEACLVKNLLNRATKIVPYVADWARLMAGTSRSVIGKRALERQDRPID